MADKSKIEWTDASWNPIRAKLYEIQSDGSGKERIGWHCEHVSEGCRNCYAERMNSRLGTMRDFKPGERYRPEREGYPNGDVKLFLDDRMLTQPLRWKKPRMIFVCSMSDIFADFVPDEWIDRMFAVMALCPQHVFQVLTKRPERMRVYVDGAFDRIVMEMCVLVDAGAPTRREVCEKHGIAWRQPRSGDDGYPLSNVWLGTSCEDQVTADTRIPYLLSTPAAVRFLSAEPLLGRMDILPYLFLYTHADDAALADATNGEPLPFHDPATTDAADIATPRLDWVIVGGESGPGARPMHPDWARSLRDQCAAAGVAFFFKQWGAWLDADHMLDRIDASGAFITSGFSLWAPARPLNFADAQFLAGVLGHHRCEPQSSGHTLLHLGKRAAGRLLDGIEHNGMPGRAG